MRLGILLYLLLFFFLFPRVAYAATMSLSSSQTNLSENDEFNVGVNLSLNTADGTSYYLRGVFYKDGTSNYCGFTWNGNNWYNGPYTNNGWEQLFPATIYQSSWSGQLKAKLDSGDSKCLQSGEYKFKVQRYTSGGSSSFDDQNVLTVNLTIPTKTPTPPPSSTPTKSQTPTPTIKSQNSTPTVIVPSTQDSAKPTQKVEIIKGNDGEVLAAETKESPIPTINSQEKESSASFEAPSPTFYIIGGLSILTIGCGILLFREWKKQKKLKQ